MPKILIISKNSVLSRYFNYKEFEAKYVSHLEFFDEDLSEINFVINLGRSLNHNKFTKIIDKVSKSNCNYIHSSTIDVFNKKNWSVRKYKKLKINEETYIKTHLDNRAYKILRIGHIVGYEFILSSILIKMLFDGKCYIPSKISNIVFPSELLYLIKRLILNWNEYTNYITCISSTKITWHDLFKKHLLFFSNKKNLSIKDRLVEVNNYKFKSDFLKLIGALKFNLNINISSIKYVDLAIFLNNIKNKFLRKKNKTKIVSFDNNKILNNHFLFEEKNLDSSFNFTLENEEYDEDIKYSVLKFFGKS